jgi:hypothetical protein
MTGRHTQRIDHIQTALDGRGIEHFNADELVEHSRGDWPGPQLFAPRERLHSNILPTAEIADEIRAHWGGPVRCISGYRSPYYNDQLVEGSEQSQHMDFRAMDIQPVRHDMQQFTRLVQRVVSARRSEGQVIGLGLYGSFVHIDTGHYDHQRDWDRRS